MNRKTKYFPLFMYLTLLVSMVLFSFQRHERMKNDKVKLIFATQTPLYLDVNSVDKLLIQKKDSTSLQQKDMLALSKVEKDIRAFPEVEIADVYQKANGSLEVYIQERTPIIRVLGEEGYYLDKMGVRMPLSNKHTPNVPLFYGRLDRLQKQELLGLLKAIQADDFLEDQVIQIEYDQGSFFLELRDFSSIIELGNLFRLEGKIKKLKTLCAYLKQEQKENKYKKINLKYQQQAVAIE